VFALAPAQIPHADEIGVNLRMVGFALALALPSACIAGVIAAWRASRAGLSGGINFRMRQGSFVAPGTRRLLVVSQIAITVMLLGNAGLLLRSFRALRYETTGFDARNVATLEIAAPSARFPDRAARLRYHQQILGALSAVDGVDRAGLVNYLPMYSGSFIVPVSVPWRTSGPPLT
jgi:hypothetical protein